MRRIVKGSMTIFLSLLMMTYLLFCMVLLEGVRNYCLRVEAQQAMELAEFSVLSEYQQELFQNYGLFFVDLDYEQGEELVSVLEQRAEKLWHSPRRYSIICAAAQATYSLESQDRKYIPLSGS